MTWSIIETTSLLGGQNNMHEPHPCFAAPSTPQAKIWRYMDLSRFLSLLHTKTLYFSRGDQFQDPYEGMLTDAFVKNIQSYSDEHLRMWHQIHINDRYDTYINCWHLSEHESAAMWKLYSSNSLGIAIVSTFELLCKAIAESRETIYIGKVEYGDSHLPSDTMPNGFKFWLTKRKSFEHEKELRAIVWKPRNHNTPTMVYRDGKWHVDSYSATIPDTPLGIAVPTRLDTLVQEVLISPESPRWLTEIVNGVVQQYGHSWSVSRSKLFEHSLFTT